jgi:uncharacterized protein involved in exopolysaccharide biosynthesis
VSKVFVKKEIKGETLMNHDAETPSDKAKQTLGLIIVMGMFVSFCLALILLQCTNL